MYKICKKQILIIPASKTFYTYLFQNKLAAILMQQHRSLGQWLEAMLEATHPVDSSVWVVLWDMLNVSLKHM